MSNETTAKKNNAWGRKKKLIIAVCAVAAVLILSLAAFLLRGFFAVQAAQICVKRGEYSSAVEYLENAGSDKANALREYASLRKEINSKYAQMITDFDISVFSDWRDRAAAAAESAGSLPKDIGASLLSLNEKLNFICSEYDAFYAMRPEILELMDVFGEINRLYTKDADGYNVTFTIAEEREKISRWEYLLTETQNYLYSLPNEDKVYLLNYLVKEAQGEIGELKSTMDRLSERDDITEFDEIRATGDGKKSFPSVESSSGVSVNLENKEEYVQYMFVGICRTLTETLGEYYRGI